MNQNTIAKTPKTYTSLEAVSRAISYAYRLGIPVDSILAFYGIDLRRDTQKEGYVPTHIWEMIITVGIEWCDRMGDFLSGLNWAVMIGNQFLGLWGFVAEKSETLGKAIDAMIAYQKIHSDSINVATRRTPAYVDIIITTAFKGANVRKHVTDFYLAQYELFVRYTTGKAQGIIESIHVQHAAPNNPALLARYQEVFRCPIYFNEPQNFLRLHSQALTLPLITTDMLLRQSLQQHAQVKLSVLDKPQQDIIELCKKRLRTLIASGRASKEALAETLHLSSRNLFKKLQLANSSYRELYHDVRLELAREYLMQPMLTIAFVANHLGFNDLSSFGRWFADQTGETPGAYRQKQAKLDNISTTPQGTDCTS